jgi:hypothetical protein
LQDLFDEIIHHEMVAAGERLDKAGDVGMSAHGNRRELQTGNPALCAGFQRGDVFGRKVQPHHLVEKLGGFGRGKSQFGDAQFSHLSSGA